MNLLYAYPIIIPMSSRGGNIDEKFLWAILIVVNAIWLVSLICALIHNAILNANSEYKNTLGDREYLFFTSLFCGAIDVIGLFFGLCALVATLL